SALREFEAVRVIEALRSGIASRHLSAILSYGREGLLEKVQRDLDTVAEGREARALILKGDYGEGKTHFLNIIFNHAQKRNFVVSFVVLSKETPFNRLDRVYPKIASNTYLPGEVEPGIEKLLGDVKPNSQLADKILLFAERELHPKVSYVVQNYFEARDTYHHHLLSGDLMGDWLPLNQLKSLHRLNFDRSAKIERFKARLHVRDYLRLLAYLIKLRGYAGWVILFDEFELVGTLGAAARGDAYFHLGEFLFPEEGEGEALLATYPVFSIASRFWPDILLRERKPDIEEIPARIAGKGDAQKAELVRRALNSLLQEAVTLEALPSSQVQRILAEVCRLHGQAYGWEPGLNLERILEATRQARLRTKIRYTLEYLDIKYLYGEEPTVRAGALEELPLNAGGEEGEEESEDVDMVAGGGEG
ncbi:MAG: DUF2791 family P-loop domain-containing protein, partial [Desulfitobacteriaceae bacterium]|nr:DUF2791 family P-loop domain-containing protein [Desulfitobacteriaceae bacterium]